MKPREWVSPTGFFEVLGDTPDLIVVNKPAGWLTHRTPLAPKEWGILELLQKQTPHVGTFAAIHRLDRATSGVLLIAKNQESARQWSKRFRDHEVRKRYIALVRGWCPEAGVIDQPLPREEGGAAQPARTRYQTLAHIELPEAVHPRHPTTRYSLVQAWPESGKHHQIRKHFEHLRHPLIGDRIYGEGRHNRYFAHQLGFPYLALHAAQLQLQTAQLQLQTAQLQIQQLQTHDSQWIAPLPPAWHTLFRRLNLTWNEPASDQP